MLRFFSISFIVLFIVIQLKSQNSEVKKDSNSVNAILKKGKFEGFSRSFFMTTVNDGSLKDFASFGTNLGGYYVSPIWKGFQVKFGGSFIFNIAGTDLTEVDSLTGKPSRYEIGLYDLQDPKSRRDLGKMEQMFIKYHFKKSSITLGRQLLKTPFINPQDGRIRPTFEEGIWFESNDLKKIHFQAGYIWGISPRSIIGWYDLGESVGFYPAGRNPDGSASAYTGNTVSKGVILGSVGFKNNNEKLGYEIDVKFWEQMILNVNNTLMLQTDWSKKINNEGLKLKLGIQGIFQNPLAKGGNEIDSMRYHPLDQNSWIIGVQSVIVSKRWSIEVNYNRIFESGRFLAPREWGREPLFTFLPRERLEGAGDVNAFSANLIYKIPKIKLLIRTSYGHYLLPDVKESRLNKYAMPSFGHAQLWLEKRFGGWADGLSIKLLYLFKIASADTYGNPNFIYNKVNMHHIDIILDYKF